MKIEPKNYSAYFLLIAIGLIIFFTITFTFSFKEKVFETFFQRPLSFAEETDFLPKVTLLAKLGDTYKARVLNIPNGESKISLQWKTEGAPSVCTGNFWSNIKDSDAWVGPKDSGGGTFAISDQLRTGIYIYSINCANEYGDSLGSSITINVGARQNNLQPHIISFQVSGQGGDDLDITKPISLVKDANLKIQWNTINLDTPYGVCVASGSWPTVYKDIGNLQVKEDFTLDKAKIYQYQVMCTNEYGYDQRAVSFVVK